MTTIVIGSRGSKLALTQTNWVAGRIMDFNPDVEVRVEIIRTKGDKILDTPLAKIGDKGLFVKELETALVHNHIDLAVHSMKDLPSEMMEGLTVGAVPARVNPCDVLISRKGSLAELPPAAKVGSSSLRRKAQLMAFRPDLEFHDLRGNLDTRVRRLQTGDFDAIVLAYAGLHRLGWDNEITEKISYDICLPAVGQGALAIQVRADDAAAAKLIAPLNDPLTLASVTAERSLLGALGGGCQTPIAAVAAIEDGALVLRAMVASLDGSEMVRADGEDKLENAFALGERVAHALLESGAREILAEVREASGPTDMGAA